MAYRIWRQDDNGNIFLIATCASRQEADDRLAGLTRVLHKQIYWIERTENGSERADGRQEE